MGDAFYPLGIGLTILAVAVSFWGLRNKSFPSSRGMLTVGIGLFAVLVVATMASAWTNAELEQDHRENEEAEEAAHEAEAAAAGQSGGALELTSPEDGSLAFDPESLEAAAGPVTIAFTNPAQVSHDVAIEQDGEELSKSDLVSDGDRSEASADLEAGEYTFYCTVPGHREGGMEGTLTVE